MPTHMLRAIVFSALARHHCVRQFLNSTQEEHRRTQGIPTVQGLWFTRGIGKTSINFLLSHSFQTSTILRLTGESPLLQYPFCVRAASFSIYFPSEGCTQSSTLPVNVAVRGRAAFDILITLAVTLRCVAPFLSFD